MSKFWGAVVTLTVVGLALILVGNQTAGINFTDLETECRYNREAKTDVSVDIEDNRLTFDGQFPINSTESELSYTYTVSEGEIVLNVRADKRDKPEFYKGTCLGMVLYKAQTDDIKPGRYIVRVKHDGKTAEEKIIRFE